MPAPRRITDHYNVNGGATHVTCKYCSRQFETMDSGGRRNWLGAMTHTAKHANEAVRRAQRQATKGR